MLDPLTALGLAGNIVQFVDFTIRLFEDAHKIHKSAHGALQENLDVETVAKTIRILQMKLRLPRGHSMIADGKAENSLEQLCSSCDEIAEELLEVLGKLKVQGNKSPWKSMRQAIKSIKGKAVVAEICGRLKRSQEALELTILVDLRQKLDLQSVACSESFKTLETSTQNIVLDLLLNRSIFTRAIDAQTDVLKETHQKEAVAAAVRHEDVKSTILATVKDMNEVQSYEHGATRQEIVQRAACDVANLRAHMDKRSDEIKSLIKATKEAKGTKERVRLAEKANAAVASLAAMDLVHGSLIGILAKTSPNRVGYSWKVESYETKESVDERHAQGLKIAPPTTKSPILDSQKTEVVPDVTSRSSKQRLATPRRPNSKSLSRIAVSDVPSRASTSLLVPSHRLGPPPPPLPPPPGFRSLQMPPVRKYSTRICDITPPKMMDEAACLKKLTTYAAYTIRKVPPRGKSGRGTWLRVEVTEERLPQEDILNQIKKLGEKGRSAADKKKEMGHNIEGQIANLLDDITSQEHDQAFEWSLVQLNAVKKPVTPKGVSLKGEAKGSLYETVRITVYVKRSPLKDLNPFILLENIEKAKAESLLRLRPPPPSGVIIKIPTPKKSNPKRSSSLPRKISAAKGKRLPPKFQPSSLSGSRKSGDKETATETDTSYSDETSWCSEEVSDTGSSKKYDKEEWDDDF